MIYNIYIYMYHIYRYNFSIQLVDSGWLSWRASTSKQALEIVAAQLADARETDGQSRMKLNRALAIFRGRRIKAHEIRSFFPSKIEWDLNNGPLSEVLELLDTQV